jgi:hypothetical protein
MVAVKYYKSEIGLYRKPWQKLGMRCLIVQKELQNQKR